MNTQEENNLNIKESILEKIESGRVSMRPRFQFTLKIIALSVVTFLVLIISLFIIAFISFSIRISHHESLLGFGPKGIMAFFLFFPWLLLALDVGLICLLEWLLRKFRFGYRFPVLYLLLVLFGIVIISGSVLDRGISFNDKILQSRERLPRPIGNFYGQVNRPLPKGQGICFCKVIDINKMTEELVVEDNRVEGTILRVTFPGDNFIQVKELLNVGDMIFVAGTEHDGVIEAFGVRPVPSRTQYREMKLVP
jgi:hypothetical protein